MKTLAALFFAFAVFAADAQIQSGKPVKVINPYPPGSSSDVMARLFPSHLSASLKTPVIVENRPGAGGAIGVAAVAQSPADGHTLLLCNSGPLVIVPLLTKKIGRAHV